MTWGGEVIQNRLGYPKETLGFSSSVRTKLKTSLTDLPPQTLRKVDARNASSTDGRKNSFTPADAAVISRTLFSIEPLAVSVMVAVTVSEMRAESANLGYAGIRSRSMQ